MRIMLWALQSPINIGMILRTAELYAIDVGIFDENRVFDDAGAVEAISDFACGALQRRQPRVFADPEVAWAFANPRAVATAITGDAVAIHDFAFGVDDCVVVGNEYDGLPDTLIAKACARVTIPMPNAYLPKPPSANPIDPSRRMTVRCDGTPNLNVAVASSIFMYEAYKRVAWSLRPSSSPRDRDR